MIEYQNSWARGQSLIVSSDVRPYVLDTWVKRQAELQMIITWWQVGFIDQGSG